eukprot:gnl/MRDRNA2_/MRDRNA2_282915_c0_seq1.p1 gnl/MRDRNA2_/MRDRNA2_282915_c0~~gnl/MRDRNA2_/MRDRNA2_282915_c0_seq1.p1  ORF type:complete len:144 (+),score=23.03 gnl/MRDRNA2_/MRDRNA2_282915_c0_seq1:1-432(+)
MSCNLGKLAPPLFSCHASPCSAPTGIDHAANPSCNEGSIVGHNNTCIAICDAGYAPSLTTLSCSAGMLTPSTFSCVSAIEKDGNGNSVMVVKTDKESTAVGSADDIDDAALADDATSSLIAKGLLKLMLPLQMMNLANAWLHG